MVGVVGVSTNRSVTGCVPALGGGLPCPGVGIVSVSTNRSVTGCVPALSGGLPCPGVGVDGISTNHWLPAVFRPSAADSHAPELAGSAFRMRTDPVWPRLGARVGVGVPDQV